MKIELKTAGVPAKEDIMEMAKGAQQVVITGEEPLDREDIYDIVESLECEEIYIETEGQKLTEMAEGLKAAGLTGVRINLETMYFDRYEARHNGKSFQNIIDGINKCVDNELKVRLNVSMEKGFSDDELMDYVQLTLQHDYEIVFMPTMPYDEIKGKIKVRPVEGDYGDVEMFKYVIGRGKIGFLKEV